MGFLISLAWKNLSRYRRRTAITAFALAAGISMFIWLDAWLQGIEQESERNLVRYETAAAKVMHRQFWEEVERVPLKHCLENPEAVGRRLGEMGLTYTPRIRFAGEIFFGEGSLPVMLTGIDPQRDESVFRLVETVVEGGYLEEGRPGLLIGRWLARDLGAGVGDELTVRTRTRYGSFQTLDLQVAGIISCPNPRLNKGVAFLPLSYADGPLEMEGAVTELALQFSEWQNPEPRTAEVAAMLKQEFPELTVQSWKEQARDYIIFAQAKSSGTSLILFLIFIIAAVGISNTMLMAVYERVREIGMMRALGMQDRQIRLTFLFEAAGIGIIGSAAGLILGTLLVFWIVHWGVDFSNILGDMEIGYRVSGLMRGAWHPQAMIAGPILGVLACMLISVIPSSRALRKNITDCLREV